MSNKKTPKIEPLVVNAIRRLQDIQGSTPREITNYISQEYDVPVSEIRPQVQLALKRGITYGILQRLKGGHYTYDREFGRDSNGDAVEIPCHGRKRFRGSMKRSRAARGRSRRRSRRGRRGKSRRGRSRGRTRKGSRRGRSRRGRGKRRRRRRSRRHEGGEVLEKEAMGKQGKTNGSLSTKDSPSAAGSSISGSSDEKHLDGPLPEPRSITAPDLAPAL